MSIQGRKRDHIELCTSGDVHYRKQSGFARYDFNHNALPEVNLADVSTEAQLLGRTFPFPLFISSMTGGYSEAGSINSMIATFCESANLPFGVGSQRVMLEDTTSADTFSIVRDLAPNAFIAANIGGCQLIDNPGSSFADTLIDPIRADAIIVHLNPLQELIQQEGDRNFAGIEEGISQLITQTELPVIVKETGAGISGDVAKRLLALGVQVIDIAGSGGTSWARVEHLRQSDQDQRGQFDEWGIPTVDCLAEITELRETFRFGLIASGGVRTPFDIIKAVALGADFTAMAQPVLKALKQGGMARLESEFSSWVETSKKVLTLLGCRSLQELTPNHLRIIRDT
ncbi:MAG: type 2 isopentenyl-diphosphate Delta-isomerase [Balneolaceae bacterium]